MAEAVGGLLIAAHRPATQQQGATELEAQQSASMLPCSGPPPPQVYGVGEESGAELTHAVVELLFTTSIE